MVERRGLMPLRLKYKFNLSCSVDFNAEAIDANFALLINTIFHKIPRVL